MCTFLTCNEKTHSTIIKWSFLAALVLQKDAMRRHAGIRRWVGRRWAEALQEVTSSLTEGDGWPLSKLLHNTGHQSTGPARGTKASTGIQMTPNGKGINSGRKCNSDSNELLIGENHFLFSRWVETDGEGGVFALTDRSDRPVWWEENCTCRQRRACCHLVIIADARTCITSPLLLNDIVLSCFRTINSVHTALNIILPRWEMLKSVYFPSFQTKTGELLTYKQWNPQNKP